MRTAKSFLIVTRNLDVQDAYVLVLRARRISTLGVESYDEALDLMTLGHVAAVLFDVEYLHDWEYLARFEREFPRAVPTVVLSGWLALDRTYRDLARHLGCAGFVAKPATPALVLHALQRAAAGSPWSEYMDVDIVTR